MTAVRRLPARTVGVLTSLEPASAGLAGVLVLDEHLNTVQWAALACVGAASAGAVVRREEARRGGCGHGPNGPGPEERRRAESRCRSGPAPRWPWLTRPFPIWP
ncbi:EamA family transporter [Streptomyces sp. NPDC004647]|uniref:EamA family transporter n=1 Tax=Streptomyces sp. NPDC004647 TaxID=3154671 RepID=UPI0033A2E9AA